MMNNCGFNEKDVLFRIGIMSDPHICYAEYDGKALTDSSQRFTNTLAAFKKISENRLDAVMMTGDYTSFGCREQAETFCSVMRSAADGIFEDSDVKPKFAIGYGNHDTCWGNNEPYYLGVEGWEKIYRKYFLLDDYEPDSYFGKGGGHYHVRLEKEGKTFHILVLEIDWYHPNAFYTDDRLKWIDKTLERLVGEEPDSYIFVGAHSPIKESGVFGTDMMLDRAADWAKSTVGGIHEVLKKYPQVVYFSGHTHYSDLLESTIMCRDYTAVNVPSSGSADLWGDSSPFLDDRRTGSVGGMALYAEIDRSGNLRIKRLLLRRSSAKTENTVKTIGGIENPDRATRDKIPYISTLQMISCRYVDGDVTSFGNDWCLAAPKKDKSHLIPLSDIRGKIPAPRFPDGSVISVTTEPDDKGDVIISLRFPAAVSSALVHHYIIEITDASGEKVNEYWTDGNWNGITTGIANGTSHLNADEYRYKLPPQRRFKGGIAIRITPIDEYANLGEPLTASID